MKSKIKDISSFFSFALSFFLLGTILLLMIIMPRLLDFYIDNFARSVQSHKTVLLILIYIALSIAASAFIFLLKLLLTVYDGNIFSQKSLSSISLLSIFCFGEGATFILLGFYFPLSFSISLVSVMLGTLLLVIRNILKEAIEAKNDRH